MGDQPRSVGWEGLSACGGEGVGGDAEACVRGWAVGVHSADGGGAGAVQSYGELYVRGRGVSDGWKRDSTHGRYARCGEEGSQAQLDGRGCRMNLSSIPTKRVLWMKFEKEQVLRVHRQRFGREGRSFAAPARVSLIGEHTDYTGGFVVAMAIGFQTVAVVSAGGDGRAVFVSGKYEAGGGFANGCLMQKTVRW